MTTNPLKK